ncbi:MAG TPA: hypothetical protein ENN06_09665 [Desulfobacteraceae bacterium]|nr:hypothetical protein [Desulfobacteraceae bacterium]
MNFIFERCTYLFDPLHHYWEHERMHRKISVLLVLLFLFSLLAIELNRQGILPAGISAVMPGSHFWAIQAAFTVVLVLEIISLIFTLPCSFSQSVGKQFEILSLILMRNAFKELSTLPEPITFTGNEDAILRILSDGFGALLLFALLGVYYRVQPQQAEESGKHADLFSFVAAKKGIALILLGIFLYMGADTILQTLAGREHPDFFYGFYTLLIITDILVVLIAQCFQPSFYSVFRNSGFALSTLIIRLALAAPPYYNVLLGVAAAAFAISMTMISSKLFTGQVRKRSDHCT